MVTFSPPLETETSLEYASSVDNKIDSTGTESATYSRTQSKTGGHAKMSPCIAGMEFRHPVTGSMALEPVEIAFRDRVGQRGTG